MKTVSLEHKRSAPFSPSFIPPDPDKGAVAAALYGEAKKFLAENPQFTSARGLVDLWNLFNQRHQSLELDDFGFDPVAAKQWEPLLEFLYRVWWRVTLNGVENIPNEGRALLVCNHSGVLPFDGGMVKHGVENEHPTKRRARMLILDMFTTLPYLQPFLRQLGEVRACPENGERLLSREELVGVFPEGVKGVGKYFQDRYRLARFGRGGFVRLALKTQSPIIPVTIVGAEEIYPMIAKADFIGKPLGFPYFPITPFFPALGILGLVPLPSKWWIDVGPPIPPPYPPEGADRPMIVNEVTDLVRSTMQRMIDSRLARRRSVFTVE